MQETEKLKQKYNELFPEDMSFSAMSEKLNIMKSGDETHFYRREFCNELIYSITAGYIEYGAEADFKKNELIQIYIAHAKKLAPDDCFFHMLSSFYQGKYKECLAFFDEVCVMSQRDIEAGAELYCEANLIDEFLEPMKEAFPGFWSHAQTKLEKLCISDGTHELCRLMDQICGHSDEEIVDILSAYIQKYPNIIFAKEYLACIYFNLKMYNNSIAWFENIGEIENTKLFAMCPAKREAMLGDAYGKLRNYKEEEKHYRKALDFNPNSIFVKNNLGYSLYKQKKYDDALDIFGNCLAEKCDLPYAANNYLRTLIALGRYKDAKGFVEKGEFRLVKNLVERVKKLPDIDQTVKKAMKAEEKIEDIDITDVEETQVDTTAFKVKGAQFSTEKILEDELTQRIENYIPVFGMKLKMYKRPGEYGRQYIIPVGRLDLFCEDDEGNLYVIELKKDKGYDDAYKQTVEYLDWFASSPKFRGKKVYGIICLNNPSKELIAKVKLDHRIRLFEYQVSYTEIKG